MPRGRPVGSKNKPKVPVPSIVEKIPEVKPLEKNDIFNTESIKEPRIPLATPAQSLKPTCICDACGAEIYCGPTIANLTNITAKASWHRNCSADRLKLCDKCAMELNILVDNWILSKNPSLNKWK